jgi:hypothetical protein
MSTSAFVVQTGLLRGPGIGRGVGLGHHGFGIGHFGSFLVHMAIWHMISRMFMRVPGLIGLVLLVAAVVLLSRLWTRRRTNRPGWTQRRW